MSTAILRFLAAAVLLCAGASRAADKPTPPNILWITAEDISPDLGCYGVEHAVTPNLDRLAAQGILYTNCFGVVGVCAPNRSSLITGMYPSSIGSHGMRFRTRLPDGIKCFPEYLRAAGYYCTNNSKTDYNFPVPEAAWDESSRKAHWRHRRPGQPFFAVFNITCSHEGQIRCSEPRYEQHMKGVPKEVRHDPAEIPVPPFHPDTPEVRRDWARYHDLITAMDHRAGAFLKELDEAGLAHQTVVFFFGDNGAGMPRCKKWCYDGGTRVPLMVRFPESMKQLAPGAPGTKTDRLVSFVDFAPTILSLAGVAIPGHMQGVAFLGEAAGEPRDYVYSMTDRMAERYDMARTVHDPRYLYLRNYRPDLTNGQIVSYTYQMPTLQVWARLAAEGALEGPPAAWFAPTKPVEELYDCENDPHNVHNLAGQPEMGEVLRRMRAEHERWQRATRDLGLLPESDMMRRSEGSTPCEMARAEGKYPLARIRAAAVLVGRGEKALSEMTRLMDDGDAAVRFWAATGLGSLGEKARPSAEVLRRALEDDSPAVRMAAAESLVRIGRPDGVMPVVQEAVSHDSEWIRLRAANVLERLGERARPAVPQIRQALENTAGLGYANRLFTTILEKLGAR